jgi:hypothetical protein
MKHFLRFFVKLFALIHTKGFYGFVCVTLVLFLGMVTLELVKSRNELGLVKATWQNEKALWQIEKERLENMPGTFGLTIAGRTQARQRETKDAVEWDGTRAGSGVAIKWNGHIYKKFDVPMAWNSATKSCEEMGGHMCTISSREELDFANRAFGISYRELLEYSYENVEESEFIKRFFMVGRAILFYLCEWEPE